MDCLHFHAWCNLRYLEVISVQCTGLLHTDVAGNCHIIFHSLQLHLHPIYWGRQSCQQHSFNSILTHPNWRDHFISIFSAWDLMHSDKHFVWCIYYTVVLWLFCYVIILLYRFVQRRDYAVQGEFYFGTSPRNSHFGDQGQTLTIAPVLLDNHRQRDHPPNIIP